MLSITGTQLDNCPLKLQICEPHNFGSFPFEGKEGAKGIGQTGSGLPFVRE